MYVTKSVIKAAEGIGLATVMFMVAVFGLAVFAEKSDTSVVKNEIAEAFRISGIQYPGEWNVNDRRGVDTFTDCLVLQVSTHKKGVPYVGALLGFISAASLVPAWYLFLEQHTIVHAWMTGRLISLFCGLGMSLALLLGVSILRNQIADF
jgi:hypothetical protein